MTPTIELDPEIEERLAQAAAREGQDPATFVQAAVEEKLRRTADGHTNGHTNGDHTNGQAGDHTNRTILSLEEEERLLDELAAGSEKLPILPPEANSRAWIYSDHD